MKAIGRNSSLSIVIYLVVIFFMIWPLTGKLAYYTYYCIENSDSSYSERLSYWKEPDSSVDIPYLDFIVNNSDRSADIVFVSEVIANPGTISVWRRVLYPRNISMMTYIDLIDSFDSFLTIGHDYIAVMPLDPLSGNSTLFAHTSINSSIVFSGSDPIRTGYLIPVNP